MNTKRVVIWGSILAVIIVVVLFYSDQIGITRSGTIELSGAPEGATIFLDNKRHSRVKDTDTLSINNLSVGTHTVVVAKDGYWPWSKKLTVANKEHIVVSAFTTPQDPTKIILDRKHADYEIVSRSLREAVLPSPNNTLQSSDGKIEIWSSQNTIQAQWIGDGTPLDAFCITGVCEKMLTVLPGKEKIGHLSFFPGRNDVLIFSSPSGVFAIEIDKRGTQNFQPIYIGSSPQFAVVDNQTIAIRDGSTILLIHPE